MARFSSFKKIIYISCSIATLSIFSDGVFGAEEKLDYSRLTQSFTNCTQALDEHIRTIQRKLEERINQRLDTIQQRVDLLADQVSTVMNRLTCLESVGDIVVVPPPAPEPAEISVIERPIPTIARGHEEIYRRFINGRLVYKSTSGERTFPIADIINPSFEGEFDLSGLTYAHGGTTYNIDKYLRIKLGYRKSVENDSKVTVWLVPRFVVSGVGNSFRDVSWTSDVGIFWTWGQYGLDIYDYTTNNQFDEISDKNLWTLARSRFTMGPIVGCRGASWRTFKYFSFIFN